MFDDYSLELLPDIIHLYNVHPQFKTTVLGAILPLLWEDEFFSITQSNDEVSFVIHSKYDAKLQKLNCVYKLEQEYRVVKLYQVNHQIDELGIVAQFATTFKEYGIPILYINSFSNNFILIPSCELHKLDGLIEF